MALSTKRKPILPKHGSLVLSDGAGTPVSITVPYSEAVEIGGINEESKEWAVYENRGTVTAIATTKVKPTTVIKCRVMIPLLNHATDGTFVDFVRGTGAYATLDSTLADVAGGDERTTVKAKFLVTRSDFSTAPSIEYNYCVVEIDSLKEGGSPEEPLMADVTITAIHYGSAESDWMSVT